MGYGAGLDYQNIESIRGNPFDLTVEVPLYEQTTSDSDSTTMKCMTSSQEFAEAMEATAEVSFDGWGASVKASMAMNSNVEMSSDEVVFVARRSIVYGFEGW